MKLQVNDIINCYSPIHGDIKNVVVTSVSDTKIRMNNKYGSYYICRLSNLQHIQIIGRLVDDTDLGI